MSLGAKTASTNETPHATQKLMTRQPGGGRVIAWGHGLCTSWSNASDPGRLARFWAAPPSAGRSRDETQEEVDVWPAGFSYPDPVALPLVFVAVPEPKTTPETGCT